MLPFQPLLFHFSADGKPLYYSSEPVAPPLPLIPSLNSSLESIELKSPALFTPSFCPTLKTLSCDEVCLLASNKGRVLGTLSPEELLPIRLSPIGAYSPPHRGVLPFLDSPDLSVLFSPLFPRSRTFPTMAFPSPQVPELPLGVEVSRARCPRGEACAHSQAGARSGAVSPERKQSRGAKNPRPPKQLRHSQSFAGVPGAGQHWMANADRAYDHLREQKKALLVGISASVEKLIAHFNTARSLVQKTQLGDSRLSPDVSYLLLNTLCPALYALVADGLKPFQKDIITGQRRSSPWSVVEASVKLGPGTRPLHSLYWQVSRLAPLRSSRQRFHAFILGLLNIKQMELWLSHLQKSSDVISVLYLPTAFFSLSQGPFPHLARELLLLVQPLSVLTFHLDLLFEHHHLPVDVRPLPRRPDSPHSHPLGPAPVAAPAQSRDPSDQAEGAEGRGGASPEHQLTTDGPRRAALVGSEESARSQYSAAAAQSPPNPQAGVSLKQTFQQVLQWGEQFTQTLLGPEGPAEPEKHQQPVPQDTGERRGSWWEQLSQASGVYTTATKERFPFTRWTKLRVAAGDTSSSLAAPPHGPSQASATEFGARGGEGASGRDLQLLKPRAEAPGPTPSSKAGSLEAPHAEELPPQARTKGCAGPRETEPPEPSASKTRLPPSDGSQAATPNLNMGGSPIRPNWLGRLFGATCPPARGFPADSDTSAAKSRRPSSWLPPSVNVLALVLKGGPSEKAWPQEQQEKKASDSPQLHRAVRALCDHTGAGDDHLSFRRGDVLQLLATVDEDWIRCCHGNNTGLVPVGYTSLIL
uniref:RUN and SH3 domain containing 1 n=1 Tax=Chrysemys picta bellii TaxID=8478 RepID=A0A8C3IRR7_CHRPI